MVLIDSRQIEQLLSSDEAARYAGISKRRLQELAATGRVDCITTTIGRLYAKEDLQNLRDHRHGRRRIVASA